MSEPRWLDDTEQRVWQAWLRSTVRVHEALERDLQQQFGRSLADYEVLVHLSEADGHRRRMADLADRSLVSRSRLTHTVDRLQRIGLVERQPCPEDRRGTWAVLTPLGLEHLQRMAPAHVESVRRHLFDALDDAQVEQLAGILEAVVDVSAEGSADASSAVAEAESES